MKKLKPIVLYRKDYSVEEELQSAQKYLKVEESRMKIPSNSLVIGRYSVLPFYKELERDLALNGSKLVNSFEEHNYIASMEYVEDIKEFTPETFYRLEDLPLKDQAYIVKGRTNSRKQQWKEKMFAENKDKAREIYFELSQDPLLQDQGIVFRKYVPLKKFGDSINGMPFSNEWRFFYYGEYLLSYNYYWTSSEYIPKKEDLPQEAVEFANKIAQIIAKRANFFVLDIAETEGGDWIVIELNDGQMSGLSENSPEDLYKNLSEVLKL